MPSESSSTARPQARVDYSFEPHVPLSRSQADRVCQAALDVLRPGLGWVQVDAFTDYSDELTDAAQAAEQGLLALAARQRPRKRRPGMGIEIDPHDDEQWALLRAYAAWSINVDLWAGRYEGDLGTFHDCAHGVGVCLNPEEVATLTDATAALGVWVPMAEIRAENKAAKQQRRADRRQERAARLRRLWPRR